MLSGDLVLPEGARGLVVFAHGSGSSRNSPRNRYVADVLQRAHVGTLLMDLLTPEEERVDELTRKHRFDVPLLASRLVDSANWLVDLPEVGSMPLGAFGSSTGGGAALAAAAERPDRFRAVVSRGGRPDLAGPALARVRAPTLLIVGARDVVVVELNRDALDLLGAKEKRLELVPGATHLFEEPGTLTTVASLAADWFARHLGGRAKHEAA
jgi:dienelactone hydrolase